jgi:hypothetical protein
MILFWLLLVVLVLGSLAGRRPAVGWAVASIGTGDAGAFARLPAKGGKRAVHGLAGPSFASASGGDPRGSATPAADLGTRPQPQRHSFSILGGMRMRSR